MKPIHLVLLLALLNHGAQQGSRVLLSLYLLDFGARPLTVGLLAGLYSLCPMLTAMHIGRLVDRIGARGPLVFGSLVAGAGLLLAYALPGIPAILAAGALFGVGVATFSVCLQNLVGLLSDAETRARNFANYSLANSTAAFLGPLVAGLAIDHAGFGLACVLFALLTFAPAAILLPMRRQGLHGGSPGPAATQGRLSDLLAGAGMRRALATVTLQQACDNLFQIYMPVYAHFVGLSATAVGGVMSMCEAAAFITRALLPRLLKRFGETGLLARAFCIGMATMLLTPFCSSAMTLGLMSFLFGLGMGSSGPVVTMLMFANSPPGRSGESMGLKVTVGHGVKSIGPVICGSLAGAFGLAAVFWLNSLMLAGGGVLNRARPKAEAQAASA